MQANHTNHIECLAFGQYVIEETGLYIDLNRVEPFLAIVPDSYFCVASTCAVGQDVYVWASLDAQVLYVVLPGVAIYAASYLPAGRLTGRRPTVLPLPAVAAV